MRYSYHTGAIPRIGMNGFGFGFDLPHFTTISVGEGNRPSIHSLAEWVEDQGAAPWTQDLLIDAKADEDIRSQLFKVTFYFDNLDLALLFKLTWA